LQNDSGLDIGNHQLPEPPNNQTYVLTRLAATAGKHMRKLRRNWSLTKNDISKSLSRMTKRKSRTDLDMTKKDHTKSSPEIIPAEEPQCECPQEQPETKSLPRKGFLNKFRRSMSLSAESASELTTNLDNKPKSTFYLTGDIDIDNNESERDSGASLSPVQRNSKVIMRPQSPPPPVPVNKPKKDKRSTSWYAEVGLFKNSENNTPRRSNTFWYAEVGLYQTSRSTPSTSSAENSGNTTNVSIKPDDFINQDNNEEYYNLKNGTDYYNDSINSFSSTETKKDQSLTNLAPDIQLRLQDEPLYQFYDAAVLESVCQDGSSDFDSDGYEEVGDSNSESRLSSRPSAMELVTPSKNSLNISRTLWCEIPEVIQSSVLSTLSTHQKKIQEAKFEMITSEASYLNSLNVLYNHFIKNLANSEMLSKEEFDTLFGKVEAVKVCSEKLIYDLEKCWQENILLHGVCDIVQKHAEENFHVYVSYCENQILLDETLRGLKEKPSFVELLRQLESSSTCQSLTLYSFLMLPMQRITRWPLLADAVLKRLSPQDSEYLTCQYSLATLNKIVNQCNEGARRKERENEMRKIITQLEFGKGVPPVEIISEGRWLIRSGSVTHMQQRSDEIKLTFGKRFVKITLHLFLFNDLLIVTKPKSENLYSVVHYCPRNLVELNSTDMLASLPTKDAQGRHLLFLTILENQNEKTVEFLLSCSSESDKERWVEAFSPPKSEDPDETLYECWDCPQVTAIHAYPASQPDELALSRGDTINVLRKMADGWYHGERMRDGQTGWFPANYTTEVANPHVRSRNLKQRYRLLAFSENYLKTK
jgi:neuronal guanine nucleotide exchange factor